MAINKTQNLIIDGHVIELCSPDVYYALLTKLDSSYHTRILNEDQIVVEKVKNPCCRTGQHYFAIKTCDGKPPQKHRW